jgi:hypothetical protein
MTLSFLWKDFKEISLFNKMSKSGMTKPYPKKELVKLISTKLAYVVFICVIPLSLTSITFSQWLIGFLIMHGTAGMILSTVFQMAHVVEGAEQPEPDEWPDALKTPGLCISCKLHPTSPARTAYYPGSSAASTTRSSIICSLPFHTSITMHYPPS